MSNRSKLRASLRAAASPPEDSAAAALADQLAGYLDAAGDTPTGPALEIIRICGPMYARLLGELGLTRRGRGLGAGATAGSPQGVSADDASHDDHRRRFAERQRGNG